MEKRVRWMVLVVMVLLLGLPRGVFAYEPLVEKKVFEIAAYTTVGGQRIAPVRIGYETYGKLNSARDNVILICHYFGGTSHAAGRYAADAPRGYWDSLIGPGKVFDTDRYFIVSTDTLSNINAKDPKVITTGPATVDPATGKPYGMTFPIVRIRDFVRVQYELLRSLGIRKLQCVTGLSMGGFQALEWAVTYPDFVLRVIPVVASPRSQAWTIGWLGLWAEAVMLDPRWNKGDYYGREEPKAGLAHSYKIIVAIAGSYWSVDKHFRRTWADADRDPAAAMENRFAFEAALDQIAAAGTRYVDANSLLYLAKACQLHDIGFGYGSYEEALSRIRARVLMVPVSTDILIPPYHSRQFVEAVNKAGGKASVFEIPSWQGHTGSILGDMAKVEIEIRAFLAR